MSLPSETPLREAETLTTTVPAAPAPMRWPLLRLLRPKQWIKNAFVLAPLLFAGEFRNPSAVGAAFAVLVLFCLASSAVYILNDLCDMEPDRRHPTKRFTRPLAAGAISPGMAKGLMAALVLVVALAGGFMPQAVAVIGAYTALNVAYSFKLKHVEVVDLFCIALGFVLRIVAGAAAIAVPVTHWMLITTLCLALFFAAIKRRQEIKGSGASGRLVLNRYSVALLDRYAEMSAMAAITFYALFTITVRPALAMTVPLVMFGFFRYWYLVEHNGEGESPTDVVWKDLPLAGVVAAWAVACMVALWSGI